MKKRKAYTRTSPHRGEQEGREPSIASQIAAIRERARADGGELQDNDIYVDEEVSGQLFVRPGLERLRDLAAEGGVDQLYIYDPDRLSRKFLYQMLFVEEFQAAGVEVIFLNRQIGDSPEDQLLLQVQGSFAEYERAKILERTRRGKLYRARIGEVAVLAGAPYGYRYIGRRVMGIARYDVVEEQARVVQRVFHQFVIDRRPMRQIARGLAEDRVPTYSGKRFWDNSVIWGMLKNPAYTGFAAFRKTRARERVQPLRRGRLQTSTPRRCNARKNLSPENWIRIPVPAIISEEVFERAQEQLKENRRFALRRSTPGRYLLRGLIVCGDCRHAWCGVGKSSEGERRSPRLYYACTGRNAGRFGGKPICSNPSIRADALDQVVWQSVQEYLRDPARLMEEFKRRQNMSTHETAMLETQGEAAARALKRSQEAVRRLVEAYEAGVLKMEELQDRIQAARERVRWNEDHVRALQDNLAKRMEFQEVVTRIEEFAKRVEVGLENLDGRGKQKLVQLVVDRVEVTRDDITIVHQVPFERGLSMSEDQSVKEEIAREPRSRAVG